MPQSPDLAELAARFGQYSVEAYVFVQESLRFASSRQPEAETDAEEAQRHLTARELVGGLLDLASERFGHLAPLVLKQWGIRRSEDVGAITFQLIDCGVFGRRPQDRLQDFEHGPDFRDALRTRLRVALAI